MRLNVFKLMAIMLAHCHISSTGNCSACNPLINIHTDFAMPAAFSHLLTQRQTISKVKVN
jgi:hypothetical protein